MGGGEAWLWRGSEGAGVAVLRWNGGLDGEPAGANECAAPLR